MNRIIFMGLLSSLLAACTGASAQWSRQPAVVNQLDAVAHVPLPKEVKAQPDATERTPDYLKYNFEKHYKSHINGTSSVAEELSITLFAPDYPRERLDRDLAEGRLFGYGRAPGAGTAGESGLRWVVQDYTYDHHPVLEPSWKILLDHRERGVVITWRGFKKQYTLEQARANLAALVQQVVITGNLSADFATRRSWPTDGWQQPYETNLRVAKAVLAEKEFALAPTDSVSRKGKWRFIVDNERPQQLHIIHELATIALPDAPFRTSEKVTFYKYQQAHWYQDNQGKESELLPLSAQNALAAEFTDQKKIYFYLMTPVDLWKAYPSETEFANSLRAILRKMESEHTRMMRDGFIAGDAEP